MATGQAAQRYSFGVKKLDLDGLRISAIVLVFQCLIDELETVPYYRPPEDSPEIYLYEERRAALGWAIAIAQSHFDRIAGA